MEHTRARAIRSRFVRRFSDLRLFEVRMARVTAWRAVTPSYGDREAMTFGGAEPNREACRYWTACAVDHA